MLNPFKGKRRLGTLSALIVVAVLAVAAVAVAKSDPWAAKYKGTGATGGTIKFHTETLVGKHKIFGLQFLKIPVTCTDNSGDPPTDTSDGQVNTLIKVKGKKFHYKANASSPSLKSTLVFDGKLTHGRSKAKGTIHIYGDLVPVNNSTTISRPCDSGVLNWTADKK
jgi:hypothetical protein